MTPSVEKVLSVMKDAFGDGILNIAVRPVEGGVVKKVSSSIVFLEIKRETLYPLVSHLNELYPLHVSCPMANRDRDGQLELVYAFTLFGGRGNYAEIPLIIKVMLPLDDLSLPSLTPIIPGITMMERETLEMVGVDFVGLRDKRRLFTPDTLEENMNPLRGKPGDGQPPAIIDGENS